MMVSLKLCRRSLLICSALIVAVAVVLVAGVIPPVKADTSPVAQPKSAAAAFLMHVIFSLLIAAILGAVAIRTRGRGDGSRIVLGFMAFFVLVLALTLTDAAFAFGAEGHAMQTTSTLLFFCTAIEYLAAVLVATTAVLLPKQT